MVDTPRLLTALKALAADNTQGDISAQDLRDFIVSVHQESFDVYNVRNYGAIGDDTNDDTSAINAAIDAANAAGGELFIPPGLYKITSNLNNIRCDVNASAGAVIRVNTGATIGMTLGGGGTLVLDRYAKLPRVQQMNKVWEGTTPTFGTDIGVLVEHCNSWNIWVPHISNFTEGLYLAPASGSDHVAHCNFYIGRLENNGRNLHIKPLAAGRYVNQNVYIGGRCHVNSGEGTDITGCFGIWLDGNLGTALNKNVFLNPSVEGGGPEAGIHLSGLCNYNEFYSYRTEGSSGVLLDSLTSGDVRFNTFLHSFGVSNPLVVEQGTGTGPKNNQFQGVRNASPPYLDFTGHNAGQTPIDAWVEWNTFDKQLSIYHDAAWHVVATWT